MKPIIEIKGLAYAYPGEKKNVLNSFSQAVFPGEIIGVVGKSGSGKSTLMKLLVQLQTPSEGMIYLDGINSQDLGSRHLYLSKIAYVNHEKNLSSNLKLKEYYELYSPLYEEYSQEIEQQLLQKFQLNENDAISSLSTGNKVKAYLIFALATQCSLIALDEITAVLDPGNRDDVYDALKECCANGRTVIIATNIVEDLINNVNRVWYIKNSNISEEKTEDVLSLFKRRIA
nr:ABC transporter ATP-binding protein [Bacteriovorax sp. HI3]